jgi:hypothetical protein
LSLSAVLLAAFHHTLYKFACSPPASAVSCKTGL